MNLFRHNPAIPPAFGPSFGRQGLVSPCLGLTRPVRFGAGLDAFQDMFEKYPEYNAYDRVNLEQAGAVISERARRHLDKVIDVVSPEEFGKYHDGGYLNLMEESADMVYEYYVLKAIQDGTITQGHVDEVIRAIVQPAKSDGKPFFEVIDAIEDKLSERQVTGFATIAELPDSKRAKTFLALVLFKFAFFQMKGEYKDIAAQTLKNFNSEVDEVEVELAARKKPAALMLQFARHLNPSAGLAPDRFRKPAMAMVNRCFDKPLTHDHLMEYVFLKQLNRQELDYYNPGKPYRWRKYILKPFEALLEASILKSAGIKAE